MLQIPDMVKSWLSSALILEYRYEFKGQIQSAGTSYMQTDYDSDVFNWLRVNFVSSLQPSQDRWKGS